MNDDDKYVLERYRRYWIGALEHVFRWPYEQAQLLANGIYSEGIRSRLGSLYLHEIAAWWIALWAMDEGFLERHSDELAAIGIKGSAQLREAVAGLIEKNAGSDDVSYPRWELARAELERFFLQFGEKIAPPPTQQTLVEVVTRYGPSTGDVRD